MLQVHINNDQSYTFLLMPPIRFSNISRLTYNKTKVTRPIGAGGKTRRCREPKKEISKREKKRVKTKGPSERERMSFRYLITPSLSAADKAM